MREDFKHRSLMRERLLSNGVDPYPHVFRLTHTIEQILSTVESSGLPEEPIATAGRIYAIRPHGGTTFLDIKDDGNKIQCQLRRDKLGLSPYNHFKEYVERGDIIGVSGPLFYTKRGELTLQTEKAAMLCKVLYDLPRTWFGLKDVETRYRQRHFDLLLNEEVRTLFITRSKIISTIRGYFDRNGFLEVETPVIQPSYGGANAKAFRTHINALDENWYLQISPELYLKRLVIGGYNKVYTICKNFRNESIDVRHNPEFSMLEAYQAYADYTDMMKLIEDLISTTASKILESPKIDLNGTEIDLTPPWQVMTMYEALDRLAGLKIKQMDDTEIQSILHQADLEVPGGYNRGLAIAKVFEHYCEDHLTQPTFITDYPKETVPLCKTHRSAPELIERFELYIYRMEMANAYTELNDPIIQEQLFKQEAERRDLGDEQAHPYDADFVEALRYGMPPTGGLGIGIDRLVMILTGEASIKEVILFPMMKTGNRT